MNELPWKVFLLLKYPEEWQKVIGNGSKKIWENYLLFGHIVGVAHVVQGD